MSRTTAARAGRRETGDEVALGATARFRFPPFAKTLPMLLIAARDSVLCRFRDHVHARGLTEQQWRVLRALREVDSLEIGALSTRCRILCASLSRILPKMNKDGLILRCIDETDHRRVIVSLTPRGRKLVEAAMPQSAKIYEQLARDIGPERLDRVYATLDEFVTLLEATGQHKPKPDRRKGSRR